MIYYCATIFQNVSVSEPQVLRRNILKPAESLLRLLALYLKYHHHQQATMNLPGYGELIECPYNKSHQLLKSRIQTHLIKCRKDYPKAHKVQCPFNVTHMINEQELDVSGTAPAEEAGFHLDVYIIVGFDLLCA